MTWEPHRDAPHTGAPTDDGDLGGTWSHTPSATDHPDAVPLAPGALGADPVDGAGDPALLPGLPPLPLTGALADALDAAGAALHEAHTAACCTATLGPDQRLQALAAVARARHTADATLLRLLSTFAREDLTAVGATTAVDLLLTHTGADPKRAAVEARIAAALTAPALPLLAPQPEELDLSGKEGLPLEQAGSGEQRDTAAGPSTGSAVTSLARLGAAHAAGAVSTDIASAAERAVRSLPARIRKRPGLVAAADTLLALQLPGTTHAEALDVCAKLAHTLDPDLADRGFDPDDLERRYLNITVHADGWVDLHGRFDPVAGARIRAAILAAARPDPTTTAPLAPADGDDDDDDSKRDPLGGTRPVVVRDERNPGQRRADALDDLVTQGTANTTRPGEPARVVITATADQLTGAPGAGQARNESTGRSVSSAHLAHAVCSGTLQALVLSCQGPSAAVLALGRAVRLFSASQRRAMLARDGGCIIPGCTAPLARLEAHHVHAWTDGGPTDVGNGVLACTRHHLLITLGVWAVRMVDGAPQVRPPASIDAARRWVLNPRPALADATTRAARQLLLLPQETWADDPPPDDGTPDTPSAHSTCEC